MSGSRKQKTAAPGGTGLYFLAFAGMAVTNGLAGSGGPGFPKSNAELSDLNPTLITPSGETFAVWGAIYLLLLLGGLEMLSGAGGFFVPRREAAILRLTAAFVLNAAWLVTFAQELYNASLVVMCLYLAAVGSAYMELEATDSDRFLPAAVGVNLAWLSVATCLNAVIAAERLGYGGEITAPSKRLPSPAGTPELAVAAMVALTAMAFAALHARRDWPFAATIAWALRGIQRGQLEQGTKGMLIVAGVCASLCAAAAALAALRSLCCRRGPRAPLVARRQQVVGLAQSTSTSGLAQRTSTSAAAAVEEGVDLDTQFVNAQRAAKSLTGLSNSQKLRVYGLFKMATSGPAKGPRPSALDVVNRAKYDAWAELGQMSTADAKRQYCALVDERSGAPSP